MKYITRLSSRLQEMGELIRSLLQVTFSCCIVASSVSLFISFFCRGILFFAIAVATGFVIYALLLPDRWQAAANGC
jgi:hypothetical protein